MKKLLLIALPLLLLVQNASSENNLQKETQSEDVLLLQKSNASLKNQLKEQKQILLNQIKKTDSVISILQSANSEIQKITDNQNSITQSVSVIQKQTASSRQIFHNISDAFSKRKMYTIIAAIGSLFIVLLLGTYLEKKLSAIINDVKQKDENLNKKIAKAEWVMEKEIVEIKALFEKQTSEINQRIEKQNTENKEKLTKQSAEMNERLGKMSNETNTIIENEMLVVKRIFHDELSKSANEFNAKIEALKQTISQQDKNIQNIGVQNKALASENALIASAFSDLKSTNEHLETELKKNRKNN